MERNRHKYRYTTLALCTFPITRHQISAAATSFVNLRVAGRRGWAGAGGGLPSGNSPHSRPCRDGGRPKAAQTGMSHAGNGLMVGECTTVTLTHRIKRNSRSCHFTSMVCESVVSSSIELAHFRNEAEFTDPTNSSD
ncbi:hypothetical protein EVAR_6112_1 [Eumeta japonica]|uniref:Uncharacterized protein n=1 Tax=Eumeta variegata TaxID=151549 RepID=A0A4C1TE22_EUMVA|nr:hypothetical protein EVAR_6112_1 [Eumeta japonica]